jgi:hypothetical protein
MKKIEFKIGDLVRYTGELNFVESGNGATFEKGALGIIKKKLTFEKEGAYAVVKWFASSSWWDFFMIPVRDIIKAEKKKRVYLTKI